MRKAKKLTCIVVAFSLIFGMTTVALAVGTDYDTWSSSVCRSQFTTSNSIVRPSNTTWDYVTVTVTGLSFTPGGSYNHLSAQPISSNGYAMGAETDLYLYSPLDIDVDANYQTMKLIIKNPYGPNGPNMESSGSFEGLYQ